MTTQEIILWSCAYLVELGAVIYFTRASARRVEGALVGGAAAGLLGLGAIDLCEALHWWHIPFASTPAFLPLFFVGLLISLAPIYLVTWRLARRFGWRGLAMFISIVAVIGPPRDYLIAANFPKWMVFGCCYLCRHGDRGACLHAPCCGSGNQGSVGAKHTKAPQVTRV